MLNKQLIIAPAAFAFGALLGWGITADLKEAQAKRHSDALRDVIKGQAELIAHMRNGEDPTAAMSVDKLQTLLSFEDYQARLPFEKHEENPTRTISHIDMDRATLSLDKEPNAFGETLEVVPQPDPRDLDDSTEVGFVSEQEGGGEKSPEGNADELDENPIPEGETLEETRANLQGLIDQYTANPDDVDTFVRHAEVGVAPDYKPPFVITQRLYAWDPDEGDDYRKVTIRFYPKDRVLLDEDEDVIEDIDATVGWKNLQQFGYESNDPDIVFIRNRQLETDFEVERVTEESLPLHVKYGMGRDEFAVNKAAGNIRLRQEDRD